MIRRLSILILALVSCCVVAAEEQSYNVIAIDQASFRPVQTDALTMGHESLAEVLITRRWYNPFPKIRYTERPDTAAAQLMEGSVLILCDTSP